MLLGLAGCAVLGAAGWYLQSGTPALPETPLAVAAPEAPAAPGLNSPGLSTPEPRVPIASESGPAPRPSAPLRATAPSASEPPTPLAVLERQFHAASAKAQRIEIAGEIAGRNDAEAVAALGRLFQAERHPDVKEALLSDIQDIDRDTAPEVRLRVLASALRGQPRNVRTTALDGLAQLDDPQVAPLLKQAMTADPDREVRDIAEALYRERLEAER